MPTKSPPWDDLRVLLEVHRQRSLLAAGKALGVATSTVARRIDLLERTLGQTLVRRDSTGTSLTPEATGLVALAEQMELGLAAMRRTASEGQIAGTVRISAGEGMMRAATRVVASLAARHHALTFELIAESRVVDIARREADLGLRLVRSESPALIEKEVARVRLAPFASRDYVARHVPGGRLCRDLAPRLSFVGFDSSLDRMPSESWMRSYGARRFVLRSNSSAAIEEAVLAGLGISVLAEVQGAALEGLVRLTTEDEPPSLPLFLVSHRESRRTPRVRTVARELEGAIRQLLG